MTVQMRDVDRVPGQFGLGWTQEIRREIATVIPTHVERANEWLAHVTDRGH